MNAVMNLWVPQNVGNFLTSREMVSFSRRTLLHVVKLPLSFPLLSSSANGHEHKQRIAAVTDGYVIMMGQSAGKYAALSLCAPKYVHEVNLGW
jgi:ABC-type transport system involved in cytochrome c biogenesis permease component